MLEEALAAGDLVVEDAGQALRASTSWRCPTACSAPGRRSWRTARSARRAGCACRARSPGRAARIRAPPRPCRGAAGPGRAPGRGRCGRPPPAAARRRRSARWRRPSARTRLLDAPGPDGCGAAGSAAARRARARCGRAPPGRGRISVALVSPGSANGSSSRSWPGQPLIAQHSISSPGTSPVTWIAIPPERASAAQ